MGDIQELAHPPYTRTFDEVVEQTISSRLLGEESVESCARRSLEQKLGVSSPDVGGSYLMR